MRQDRFKRNGGVYKCQTFGTLHTHLAAKKKFEAYPGNMAGAKERNIFRSEEIL